MSSRTVDRILESLRTREGAGFSVRRPFPTRALAELDPFLLLDEMGPMDVGPGEAKGAPDHPHRGFETVTYLLSGAMEHRDSQGNSGRLAPGDVQWMTAGDGVIHSEMPTREIMERGGRMHGFQLWVNLPRRDKRMRPRYQDVPSERIPVARTDDGSVTVKVIAGEALGARAVIDTRIPITYLHFTLRAGARFSQPVAPGQRVFAYVFRGAARFGADDRAARDGHVVIFRDDGDEIAMMATEETELLLIGGAPLEEPIARYGPFVMNEQREIVEAIDDFRRGRFGTIPADVG